MPSTRQQFCDRVLRMLNMTDGDAPASAGDIQIVNGLIEPVIGRLARQGLVYVFDYGTPGTLSSGAIPDSIFYPLAQVFALAAAPDFGASIETYKAIADLGEQTLTSLRYKADRASNPTPPAQGTRGDLCQRTLKMLSIIKEGDNPTTEALTVIDNLIGPTVDRLSRQGIVFIASMGTAGNLASGSFDDTTIFALAQVLTKPAASAFGTPYIGGTLDDYAKLADDGEQTLISMRFKADRSAMPTAPTAGTRGDLAQRTLKAIGVIKEGEIPSQEALNVIDGQIDATAAELARLGVTYGVTFGTAGNLASGSVPNSKLVPISNVLAEPAARAIGAPFIAGTFDDYKLLRQQGEQSLIGMRYKADWSAAAAPAQGTRGDLCQRTLKMLGVIREGDIATSEAVAVVDNLITPQIDRLSRLGIVLATNLGTVGNPASGNISDSEIVAIAQVLTKPAFSAFHEPYVTGKLDDYSALAADGEQALTAMRYKATRSANATLPTPGTRGDVCSRTLKVIGVIKQGDIASDMALQAVDEVILPTIERLSRQGIMLSANLGTVGNPASGAFTESEVMAFAQVLAKPAAAAIGAPYVSIPEEALTALAQEGEATLTSVRYKAPRNTIAVPPTAGTRKDLCYRTLKIIGIIREGDVPTDEAVQVVNRLINPTLTEIARRGIQYTPQTGSVADLNSGTVPPEEVLPLAQFLSRNAAAEFGPPYITGTIDNYASLANDAEMKLRRMTAATPIYETMRAQYW